MIADIDSDDRDQIVCHVSLVYVDADDPNPLRDTPDPKDRVESHRQRGRGNGAYPIEGPSEGSGIETTDIGENIFTRDFADSDQFEGGGYHDIIDKGDDVRIPLTTTWSTD